MARSPSALRQFVERVFSPDMIRRLVREHSQASRYVRTFLRAKALGSFSRSDLHLQSKRTVDRKLAEWTKAGILRSVGRKSKKLPWDPRARREAEKQIRRDIGRHRRGRPEELYQIVDPLAEPRSPRVEDLPALVAFLRDPASVEFLARPLKLGMQLLTTEEGRGFFSAWIVPLFPQEARAPWNELINAFESADPEFAARLPDEVEAYVTAVGREWFPRVATMLETIAAQAPRPEAALGTGKRPASHQPGDG